MRGTVSTGRTFGKSIDYCLKDKLVNGQVIYKDRAEILYYHQCYGREAEMAQQFKEVARLNQNMSKPVMHISLNLPPEESLPKSKLVQLARECASHMDFENHQYVVILHKDTSHQHVHLVANRIGFDQHVTSDSCSYAKIDEYCREAEVRHHLTQQLHTLCYRTEEERQIPRHGLRLDGLKENIHQSLLMSKDVDEFKVQMQGRGYTVYHSQRGMAFMDEKHVVFKGCEAGYPFHKIESILSQDLSLRQEQEKQRLEEELRLKQTEKLRLPGEEHQHHTQRQHQRHSHRLHL
jgi:hypothetical protein